MNETEHIKNLLRSAYDSFLDEFYDGESEPNYNYLPYDFNFLKHKKLSFPAGEIIHSETVELTNIINSWQESLQKWSVWNKIIENYSDNDAWDIRTEFINKNTHFCLMQPSRVRDLITTVATNSFHQILLITQHGYKDHLFGEKLKPIDKPRFLKRTDKEKRMQELHNKLIAKNDLDSFFIQKHSELNTSNYESQTSDYRNLFCHSIPPRFAEGLTRLVKRDIVQATQMVEQSDGTYNDDFVPDKIAVRYSLGGTPPLQLTEIFSINLSQFKTARDCYNAYLNIITHI